MPISTRKIYVCPKCGYTTIKSVGDVITPTDFICPKCGAYMEIGESKMIRDTLFDILKSVFTKK